jgi:hypothetical protein
MRSLPMDEIEIIASQRGVDRIAVEYFLNCIGVSETKADAILKLYYDSRRYSWNMSTREAIETVIKTVFAESI